MRSAPQVLFSATIRKIRSRSSLLVDLLPMRTPLREIHFQYSLNPARCQRTTVSGWTRIRAFRHPDHRRRSITQSSRSPFENRCCGRRRASTQSCCRNARFSNSRSRRARKEQTNTRHRSLRRRSMALYIIENTTGLLRMKFRRGTACTQWNCTHFWKGQEPAAHNLRPFRTCG